MKALLGELADLPAEAEEEARTVDQLRAKVRDLEKTAKRAGPAPVDEAALEAIRADAMRRAEIAAAEAVGRMVDAWQSIAKAAQAAMVDLQAVVEAVASFEKAPISVSKVGTPRPAPALSL